MKIVRIIVISFALSSCATQSYVVNGGGGAEPTKESMQIFFINGLGQKQEINAASVCGGAEKVAKVESHMSFLNVVFGVISGSFFSPRQAKVYCTG